MLYPLTLAHSRPRIKLGRDIDGDNATQRGMAWLEAIDVRQTSPVLAQVKAQPDRPERPSGERGASRGDALDLALAVGDQVLPIRFVPSMGGGERKKRIHPTDSIRSFPHPLQGTGRNE